MTPELSQVCPQCLGTGTVSIDGRLQVCGCSRPERHRKGSARGREAKRRSLNAALAFESIDTVMRRIPPAR